MKRFFLPILLQFTLLLAACSPLQSNVQKTAPTAAPVSNAVPAVVDNPANVDLTRTDEQGAVVIEVTPLNLDSAIDTLEFDISMNTHSIDLSMDLAQLATLTTDTGLTVQASKWDATPGGHHVPGKLIFPASQDGKSILDGAGKLTLTIVNVDSPSRVFEWPLQ
jgi:hypothetical protein